MTGTFVNRNHFSGYLEMIVPLAIGLAVARMNMMTFGIKGFREKLLLWTSKGILVNVLILAAAVVMSIAVVLSNSRSGLVTLAFTVFLFFGFSVAAFSRSGFRQPWVGKTVRTTFLCVTVLALTVGVGSTIKRFALDDLLHEDRPQYWANTVRIVGDFPLFGTGLGTFASAYGAYEETSASEMRLVHAHNDFLEYVAELGVVGALLLIGGVLYLAVLGLPRLAAEEERPGAGAGHGRHRLARRDRPPCRHRFQSPHSGQHGPFHRRPVPDHGHGLLPENLRLHLKKILSIAGLAVLVLLQAAVAWNARLYWRAKDAAAGAEAKARLLARAEAVFPWNAAVPFELGKIDFERATEALGDPAARDALFRRSVGSYLRSLRLDPASPAAHFELAQALLYMSYLGLPEPVGHFEEYRRAAELTGHNSQIHYDVGKVLLGRWETLAAGEKDFAIGILKRSLAGKSEDRLPDLLETWSLSSRELSVIEAVLPDDAGSLRTYARFLGERGLSLEARRSALARAEALEVARAKSELDRGRREAEFFRTAVSSEHCAAALASLRSVKFYQTLAGLELFDPKDYAETLKGVRRLLAMNRIEETRSLADPDGTIAAYLAARGRFHGPRRVRNVHQGAGTPGRGRTGLSVPGPRDPGLQDEARFRAEPVPGHRPRGRAAHRRAPSSSPRRAGRATSASCA